MAVGDLFALCREYLQACEAAVVLAPGGAIPRAFVAPGVPAFDCCPQLTVHAGGPAVADTAPLQPPLQPMHRIEGHMMVNLVSMTATVIRCTPTLLDNQNNPVMPAAADIEAASEETLGDLWAIWNYVATQVRAKTLFASDSPREVIFDAAVAVVTSGGCAGWQIPIRVMLGGFRTP